MKKLKLIPISLMLVLCVGILVVGVFAITPTKNKITGTVNITASNPEVFVECLIMELNKRNIHQE